MSVFHQTIQAVMLDMDGTLIDTETVFQKSWFHCAQLFNFEFNITHYQKLIGRPLESSFHYIQSLLPENVLFDEFMSTLFQDQKKRQMQEGVQFRPGAKTLLKTLSKLPYLVGLVSSSKRSFIHDHFKALSCESIFDIIIAYEDTALHKPDPAPYKKACQALQVNPKHTLAVEDSNIGSISALEAGCQTIFVPQFIQPNTPLQPKLLAVYDSLEHVTDYLIKIS
ncbi:MAG: HAD family phosphatase [Endozoicomonadaceae bacterium]|nr:HAD family phosphatase [Endozoicomonadaceae bacterium]MBE8232695.1 HAD family phosphatase [Endozoicomonadaceae bacterium]